MNAELPRKYLSKYLRWANDQWRMPEVMPLATGLVVVAKRLLTIGLRIQHRSPCNGGYGRLRVARWAVAVLQPTTSGAWTNQGANGDWSKSCQPLATVGVTVDHAGP